MLLVTCCIIHVVSSEQTVFIDVPVESRTTSTPLTRTLGLHSLSCYTSYPQISRNIAKCISNWPITLKFTMLPRHMPNFQFQPICCIVEIWRDQEVFLMPPYLSHSDEKPIIQWAYFHKGNFHSGWHNKWVFYDKTVCSITAMWHDVIPRNINHTRFRIMDIRAPRHLQLVGRQMPVNIEMMEH